MRQLVTPGPTDVTQVVYQDEDEDDGPQPDPLLEAGNGLPMRIKPDFPPELIGSANPKI